MTRSVTIVGTAAISVLCIAAPAGAETIQITSGALVWNLVAPDQVTLSGDGFTFEGTAADGTFVPGARCTAGCTPGESVNLLASWTGSDLTGTATVDGTTFTDVGGLNASTALVATWSGTLVIPTGFTGGSLTAPFGFAGVFHSTPDLDLTGTGTATLDFSPHVGMPGAFLLTSARYEFDSAPVPEPMSMWLVGSGLAGLAALRRRRARSRDEETA